MTNRYLSWKDYCYMVLASSALSNIAFADIDQVVDTKICGPLKGSYTWNNNYSNIVSGDFDGNGYSDLAVVGDTGWYMRFNEGKRTRLDSGDLYFHEENPMGLVNPKKGYCSLSNQYSFYWANKFREKIIIERNFFSADINGDGRDDIGVEANGTWIFKYGTGNGSFDGHERIESSLFPFQEGQKAIVGNFNYDNLADVGMVDKDGKWSIRLNTGTGFSKEKTFYWARNDVEDPVYLSTDHNGDGLTDLGIYDKKNELLYVRYSNPEVGAQDNFSHEVRIPLIDGYPGKNIISGDFNADGLDDYVKEYDGKWSFHFTKIPNSGILTKKKEYHIFFENSLNIDKPKSYHAFSGDFDGNNLDDVGIELDGVWYFERNAGDGTFSDGTTYPWGNLSGDAIQVIIGDFDADGKDDLGIFEIYNNILYIRYNQGWGKFGEQTAYSLPFQKNAWIRAGDFNGDKKDDLFITFDNGSSHQLRFNLGNGTFGEAQDVLPDLKLSSDNSLFVGDFNADEIADIGYTINDLGTLNYLYTQRKTGGGYTFFTDFDIWPINKKQTIIAGKFNYDGFDDIGIFNSSGLITIRYTNVHE